MSSRHRHEQYNQEKYKENSMQKTSAFVPIAANQNLAEATVPYQVYSQIWDPQTGLRMGTIFPELYRPYEKQNT